MGDCVTAEDITLPHDVDVLELAQAVLRACDARKLTVATAESCTGGLVSAALTSVPGSSSCVKGGIVSYAISVKHCVLDVSSDVLDDPSRGAVSPECACQMAVGVRKALASDVAVSVTGIAGPGGEEPDKPVGTVWFGVASEHNAYATCRHLTGSRDEVRCKAVYVALALLARTIENDASKD